MVDEHTPTVAQRVAEMPVIGICTRCSNDLRPWWTLYSGLGARRICYECQLVASRHRYFRRVGKPVPPKRGSAGYVHKRAPVPTSSLCADCMKLFVRTKRQRIIRCADCTAARYVARRGAAYAKRQKALQSGDRYITWRSVGERDGWICHLCSTAVEQRTHPADPWVATVDHLVPLIAGGLHEWSNVRLAHRRCNSARGARPLEETDGRR